MSWFTGLQVPAQVAIITGGIAIINMIVTWLIARKNAINTQQIAAETALTTLQVSNKSNETLEKRRFIDAISMQRIEWINNLRHAFVSFNELMSKRKILIFESKTSPRQDMLTLLNDNTVELFASKSNIELYLNPTEFFSENLSIYLNEILEIFGGIKNSDDNSLYRETVDTIHYIEQVILKAEWRRIKEETKKGEQLSKEEMSEIFDEVAKEIDLKIFKKLKKDNLEQ